MTSHETYREQLLDLAYGELGKREERALRAHLESCAECRAELGRMTATRGAMSALPAEPAPERGEGILLAAAREATRDRNRPWLPSWVWGASVGVVGVAAVALVAVRLSGAVRHPAAQHDRDALVSRSAAPVNEPESAPGGLQAEAPPLPSPGAEAPASPSSASSNAAATEPAQAAPPPAAEAPAAVDSPAARFKTVPAPKGDLARRKEGAATARGGVAGEVRSPATPASPSRVERSAADEAAVPAPRSAPTTSAAPAAPPAASPAPAPPAAEAQFAQPPPGKASEPVLGARRLAREQESATAGDSDRSALEEKREAAPAVGSAGLVGTKARAAKSAPEDAVARYERLRAAGRLRTASTSFPDCPGEASRRVETDEQGRVVKVTRRGVLGGTPYEAEQYYGEDGQLGAVRYRAAGTTREQRPGSPGADAGGVPASLLEPAGAADAGLGAPPRCGE